jgi:trimeric autotransporter adhesin
MNSLRSAAALIGSVSFAVALTVPTVAAKASTPKVGGTCTKSQSGKVSGALVCSKSGSSYKWVKRSTAATTTKATTTSPPAQRTTSPVDVVDVVFGTPAATLSTKVDLACTGTFAAGGTEARSVNFTASGGSSQVALSLVEPSTTNPAGSSCTASATISGATPTGLQLLVNGRTVAGPSSGVTLTAPAFTAPGPFVVTVIAAFGNSSTLPTPVTTVPPAGATTTLAPGTTTPPPASGRPEVKNVYVGPLPATFSGMDVKVTCTPVVPGGLFQIQTVRLGIAPSTAVLPLTLAPATATTSATQCQVEAAALGTFDNSQVLGRVLVNGVPTFQATTGSTVNSPAFAAPQAFTVTVELTFPGTVSSTTIAGATTTTLLGATTTTLLGATTTTAPTATSTTIAGSLSTIAVAASGVVPSTVASYLVEVTCTNVMSLGAAQPSQTFFAQFGIGGGSVVIPFTPTASSQCSVTAKTNPATVTSGSVSVAVNGVVRGSGTAGAATVSAFAATNPLQVRVAVAY